MSVEYTSFETRIGFCGVAWSTLGVASVRLPVLGPGMPSSAPMDRLLAAEFPEAHAGEPSRLAREGIEALVRSLAGENADDALLIVALDLASVPPFARSVYSEARRIPRGQTRSYGDLARALGKPGAARAVGQALGRNPVPLLVPCHRIVAQGGGAGGFTAPGGLTTKARLLAIEGNQLDWDA